MLIEQTLQTLTDLNLWGMKQALLQQQEQPKTHDLGFEERLGLIVDYEKTYRHNKKIERLLKMAKLRHQTACLESIDYQHQRGFQKENITTLATNSWIKEAFNLLITGPTGVGKSWIACALGHQACRMGLSVLYCRFPKLLEELRLAHIDGSYHQILRRFSKIDLLILDDWGLERLNTEQRRDFLEMIEDRHQLKSVLITSQMPSSAWHEIIGDPTIADATLDRLLSRSIKLDLKGESMRKKTPLA